MVSGQELVDLIGRTTVLRKVGSSEYAGACPFCGGTDRFHVNLASGWFCRKCTGVPGADGHWGDAIDFIRKLDGCSFAEARERLGIDGGISDERARGIEEERERADAQERERKHKNSARILAQIQGGHLDEIYHANLGDEDGRGWKLWEGRGLSRAWVQYWGLGYCPARVWTDRKGENVTSDSLTIPYYEPEYGESCEFRLKGLQHRLLDTGAIKRLGKYRPERGGIEKELFWTSVTERHQNPTDLLLVEGEIKAMVTWANLWTKDTDMPMAPMLSVVGVPGMQWRGDWLALFRSARRVWVCFDPDETAREIARKLAVVIGAQAAPLNLPDKIDDLFNIGALSGQGLIDLLDFSAKDMTPNEVRGVVQGVGGWDEKQG